MLNLQELQELKEDLDKEYEALQNKAKLENEDRMKAFQNEMEENLLQDSLNQSKFMELSKKEEDFKADIQRIEEEHEENLREISDKHQEEIEELKVKHDKNLEEIESNFRKEKDKKERALREKVKLFNQEKIYRRGMPTWKTTFLEQRIGTLMRLLLEPY